MTVYRSQIKTWRHFRKHFIWRNVIWSDVVSRKKSGMNIFTSNSYAWAIDSHIQSISIYQILLIKDNSHILSNCTFGDNLFPSRLLQRSQKSSLLGKGLSRNVTPYIICSSHIDWLKKVVARWHQKRAVTHLLPYHNIGNCLRTLSIRTFCDHAENMRLTLLSSSQLLINHFLLLNNSL